MRARQLWSVRDLQYRRACVDAGIDGVEVEAVEREPLGRVECFLVGQQ